MSGITLSLEIDLDPIVSCSQDLTRPQILKFKRILQRVMERYNGKLERSRQNQRRSKYRVSTENTEKISADFDRLDTLIKVIDKGQ